MKKANALRMYLWHLGAEYFEFEKVFFVAAKW